MAFIDNVKDTLTKAGKTTVQKTKDIAAIAKVTADKEETKSLLKAVYVEIGKRYCEGHDKESADPDYTIDVATAENLKEQLEALKAERLALRGKVRCAACGKAVDDEFVFCPFCGEKLPENAPEEPADDEPKDDDDFVEVDLDEKDED